MKSYNRINRDYLFQKELDIRGQHFKIVEEFEEVMAEVSVYDEGIYIKNRVEDYVNELLDLQMAINNQLVRIADAYGENAMKTYCKNWDDKILDYKQRKYKGDDK